MTRRTLFLIGLLIELVAVFGFFLPYALRMQNGTPITLQTIPVDPRSIFRGDYVTLDYVVGQSLPSGWTDEGIENPSVYVTLEPNGEIYERVVISREKPVLEEGQVCLRGLLQQWGPFGTPSIRFPDIGQYFVEEGMGRELEQAVNARRLLVDAVVSPSCKPLIRGVILGPEVPPEETPWGRGDIEFPPMEAPVRPETAPIR